MKWMGSPALQPDVSRNPWWFCLSVTQATGGDALTSEILKRTSKRYQDPFFGAWLEISFTHMKYQHYQ